MVPAAATGPATERPKATIACTQCRTRKLKCDGLPTCSNCTLYATNCEYAAARKKSGPPKGYTRKSAGKPPLPAQPASDRGQQSSGQHQAQPPPQQEQQQQSQQHISQHAPVQSYLDVSSQQSHHQPPQVHHHLDGPSYGSYHQHHNNSVVGLSAISVPQPPDHRPTLAHSYSPQNAPPPPDNWSNLFWAPTAEVPDMQEFNGNNNVPSQGMLPHHPTPPTQSGPGYGGLPYSYHIDTNVHQPPQQVHPAIQIPPASPANHFPTLKHQASGLSISSNSPSSASSTLHSASPAYCSMSTPINFLSVLSSSNESSPHPSSPQGDRIRRIHPWVPILIPVRIDSLLTHAATSSGDSLHSQFLLHSFASLANITETLEAASDSDEDYATAQRLAMQAYIAALAPQTSQVETELPIALCTTISLLYLTIRDVFARSWGREASAWLQLAANVAASMSTLTEDDRAIQRWIERIIWQWDVALFYSFSPDGPNRLPHVTDKAFEERCRDIACLANYEQDEDMRTFSGLVTLNLDLITLMKECPSIMNEPPLSVCQRVQGWIVTLPMQHGMLQLYGDTQLSNTELVKQSVARVVHLIYYGMAIYLHITDDQRCIMRMSALHVAVTRIVDAADWLVEMNCLHLWPFAEPTLALAQSVLLCTNRDQKVLTPMVGSLLPIITPNFQKRKRPTPPHTPLEAPSPIATNPPPASLGAGRRSPPRANEVSNHGLLVIIKDVLQASIDRTNGKGPHAIKAKRSIDVIMKFFGQSSGKENDDGVREDDRPILPPPTRLRLPRDNVMNDLVA